MRPVNEVQRTARGSTAPTREQMKKDITSTRRFNKEGIEKENIFKGKKRKETNRQITLLNNVINFITNEKKI